MGKQLPRKTRPCWTKNMESRKSGRFLVTILEDIPPPPESIDSTPSSSLPCTPLRTACDIVDNSTAPLSTTTCSKKPQRPAFLNIQTNPCSYTSPELSGQNNVKWFCQFVMQI